MPSSHFTTDLKHWLDYLRSQPDGRDLPEFLALGAAIPLWNVIVAGLATSDLVPDARVNEVARIGWSSISSRIVTMIGDPECRVIHFTPIVSTVPLGRQCGVIPLPLRWAEAVVADPVPQIAKAAYILSEIRDLWNGVTEAARGNFRAIVDRASRIEVRILRLFADAGLYTPGAIEQTKLKMYPASIPGDWYDGLPFDMERARDRFTSYTVEAPLRQPTPCPNLAFDEDGQIFVTRMVT